MPGDEFPELGVEEAVRRLIRSLPDISAGFKRTAVPDELRPLFSSSSMGPRHIPALAYLLADGTMSVSQLAERLGVTTTTASLMATQLAEHGLVLRAEDPADRRRTLVSIAPDRVEAVQRWLGQRAEPIRRTVQRLDGADRAVLVAALDVLADELRAQPRGGAAIPNPE